MGSSEANSGPFLIITENFFSKLVVSHCTKPGSSIKLYSRIDLFFKIFSVNSSERKAEIETGAFSIVILCSLIGFITFSIVG